MFRNRVFGNDAFHVVLEYGPGDALGDHAPVTQIRLRVAAARLEFDWTSAESEAQIVERFTKLQSQLLMTNMHEKVLVELEPAEIEDAATFPEARLGVRLSVAAATPKLRSLHFTRTSSSGTASDAVLTALLKHIDLSGVWRVKSAEGLGNFWASCAEIEQWQSLRNLTLGSCNLAVLPSLVGQLATLKILRLSHNRLSTLPGELGQLTQLQVLAVDHNLLSSIPGMLGVCSCCLQFHVDCRNYKQHIMQLQTVFQLELCALL